MKLRYAEKFYLPQNQTALMGALADAGYSAQTIAKLEWRDWHASYFAQGIRKKKLPTSLSEIFGKGMRHRWRHENNTSGFIYEGLEQFRYVFYAELPTGVTTGRRYSTKEVRTILQNRIKFVEN